MRIESPCRHPGGPTLFGLIVRSSIRLVAARQVLAVAAVVPRRKITPVMHAARLLALLRRPDHQPGHRQQVLELPPLARRELPLQHVPTPEGYVALGLFQA